LENSKSDILINKILFNKYTIIKKIGKGSFGNIYLSKEKYTNLLYAIKIENKNICNNFLENEANILLYLNCPKTPSVKSFGYTSNYNVLIMELLGKSLEDIFENILQKKKMSVRCVCNLGYQMIEILEFIHKKNIIHRDIKPDNFLMSNGDNKYLYLLDFGLAKKYRESENSPHYPFIEGKKLTGTARYASVNALNGVTQSRRDDLESVGYVLVYFLKGCLPWQGLKVKVKEERYKKILEKKKETTSEELCSGLPYIFQEFVSYTRNLDYLEEPNYDNLRNLFFNFITNERNERFDFIYDWTTTFDIKKRKDFNNDLNSYYQFSEKSVNRRQTESIIYKKKKNKEVTTTNGNNLTLYRIILT
jgi:serine/threonine protein kinase